MRDQRVRRAVRRFVTPLWLGVTLSLIAAGGAEAKTESTVSVCGVAACMSTDDPGLVGPLHSTFAAGPRPKPAPFYVVRFDVAGRRNAWSYIYAPSISAMRSDDFGKGPARWQDAALLAGSLPDLTRLEPYPASAAWRWSHSAHRTLSWITNPPASHPTAIGQLRLVKDLASALPLALLITGLVAWRPPWSDAADPEPVTRRVTRVKPTSA
jgi:hypothetical protein